MATPIIRPILAGDLDALYAISLATGDRGEDASALYVDPRVMGHIYSAPYAVLAPELGLVLEHKGTVAGFALGVTDTAAFEAKLERDWWPRLRMDYRAPDPKRRDQWSADERRANSFYHPAQAPRSILTDYPAHMHMNLLPSVQGKGFGSTLLDRWLRLLAAQGGAAGLHVGVNAQNNRALSFWQAKGFAPLTLDASEATERTRWFGRKLRT
ncbi:MAG: GNAT family N-acetyltransferase [Pseudomonadota bacterium]